MNVPLLDLKRQYASIRQEIDQTIREVVESQYFIKGPKVTELETRIAEYCGSKRAVGVASGTDALLLCLMACGVGRGDEVITTPYTFFATAGSISRLGAVPVFVDIDRSTYNLDPALIEAAVTPRTKAVIPVHLYGQCADMDPIMDVARRHKLTVIEDACQSIGSEYKGRRAGSIGHAGCFSFFPSKNLGAFGDAGMVTTDDAALADELVSLREHGMKDRYFHDTVGINSRLDALQAAVLLVKLGHLDAWSDGRARNAEHYNGRFAGSPVGTPRREPHCRHIYNQYMIRVRERDALEAHLKSKGIGCALYYPLPLHLQKCFRDLPYKEGDLPESEAAARETLSIPVFTELRQEEMDHVADTVLEFCGQA